MQRRTSLSVIAVTATLWFGSAQAQVKEIAFGIISTESSANLKSSWQPLLDDMQKATGLKVNAFFAPDYAGVVEGMRFNKVQVAWMGNKSGMEAVEKESLQTLTFAGFVSSNDNQWLPIRQLELARERGKVEGDANLAADEKSKRLNEIDGKLSELSRQLASAK